MEEIECGWSRETDREVEDVVAEEGWLVVKSRV